VLMKDRMARHLRLPRCGRSAGFRQKLPPGGRRQIRKPHCVPVLLLKLLGADVSDRRSLRTHTAPVTGLSELCLQLQPNLSRASPVYQPRALSGGLQH
jgi:hypothetical protein